MSRPALLSRGKTGRRGFLSGALALAVTNVRASLRGNLNYAKFDPLLWAIVTDVPPSDSGLMSLNRDGWMELGAQRAIPRYLGGAIMQEDAVKTDRAFEGLAKTFSFQDKDGGFPYHAKSGGKAQDLLYNRLLTEVFFIVELLQAYHIALGSNFGMSRSRQIRSYIERVRTEAEAIHTKLPELVMANLNASNRVTLILRFVVLSNLCYDLNVPASLYFNAAGALETNDGFFMEKGGHDLSYDASGIMFGILALLVKDNVEFESKVIHSLAWLSGKIGDDGNLLTSGDTRTAGQETFGDHLKAPNYKEIASALILGSGLIDNRRYLEQAKLVLRNSGRR